MFLRKPGQGWIMFLRKPPHGVDHDPEKTLASGWIMIARKPPRGWIMIVGTDIEQQPGGWC